MQLENLCLLSAFVPTLPTDPTTGLPMGTMQSQGLGSVVYSFAQDPNNPNPNLPAAKLVTIMNNSSDVIYPIFYGTNSTADDTAGQVVRVEASGGTGYTGTFNVTFTNSHGGTAATAVIAGNNNIFGVQSFTAGSGYQPGDQVTVKSIAPIGNSVLGTKREYPGIYQSGHTKRREGPVRSPGSAERYLPGATSASTSTGSIN